MKNDEWMGQKNTHLNQFPKSSNHVHPIQQLTHTDAKLVWKVPVQTCPDTRPVDNVSERRFSLDKLGGFTTGRAFLVCGTIAGATATMTSWEVKNC